MRDSKKKDWLYVIGHMVASLALVITVFNVNTTCFWIAHQNELPNSAKKLRKF